jgi:hypothetical protein
MASDGPYDGDTIVRSDKFIKIFRTSPVREHELAVGWAYMSCYLLKILNLLHLNSLS